VIVIDIIVQGHYVGNVGNCSDGVEVKIVNVSDDTLRSLIEQIHSHHGEYFITDHITRLDNEFLKQFDKGENMDK
jgi:hypothetical protein